MIAKKKHTYHQAWIPVLIGIFVFLLCPVKTQASTGGHSADDAVNWVRSQVGKGLDYDGVYGNQCVDLICYYYKYLGQTSPGGNGKDYSWNQLPAGWQRLQGVQPQKGDILVYSGNSANPYGHVAIYAADRETYHQNFDTHPYVEKITYRYNGLGNPYWGVIRPDWNSTPINNFTSILASEVTQNSAKLSATTNLTYITECGYRIGKSTGSMNIVEKEYPNSNTLNIWYTASNLEPGVTYYYQFYYISGSNIIWSPVGNFTTNSIKTTAISLDKTSVSLTEGETAILTPTITPANATNKTVIWSSSNANVAEVTGGKITAKAEGTATITAKTADSGIIASCTVKVIKKEVKPVIPDGVNQSSDGNWYYYKDGKVVTDFTGLAKNANGVWYCKNGKVQFGTTGVIESKGTYSGWYYVKKGQLQTGQVTVKSNSTGWWYINKDGKVDFGFTGLAKNENGVWYCKKGQVQFGTTDVIESKGIYNGWYYVKKGQLQTGKTTVEKNSSGWWYIDKNGKVDFNFNGLAKNENGVWYCQKGKVQFNTTDVLYSKGTYEGWYYVKKGQLQTGKVTVEQNSTGWWYIGKDGKVDFNFTGIASNAYGSWYLEKGKVNFNKNMNSYTDPHTKLKYKVVKGKATRI